MRTHRLEAGPGTVHWGFFDASLRPLITIEPGDEVTMSTVSGPPEVMPKPGSGLTVPAALSAIYASVPQELNGPHIMTGPVAVRGAKAGQVLEVRIKTIELNYDWGYNTIRPLVGALPDDFAKARLIHIPLDRTRMIGRLPCGLELPLKPFFGVMVVAPPPAWGPVASPPPRRNGGNIDNKELVAGTTLYLPIQVDGALFSVGDGHGVQGDGEVCITAIETGLIGTFELHVRDDMKLEWPRAETPTHVITMAFDPDLDDAVVIALRDMIELICARTSLSREDGPKLLLLDEPSLGLSPVLVSQIFQLIASLRDRGTAILLSEQNARLSLAIADRGYVIENGHVAISGTGRELLQSNDIAKRYLGVGADLGAANVSRDEHYTAKLRHLMLH